MINYIRKGSKFSIILFMIFLVIGSMSACGKKDESDSSYKEIQNEDNDEHNDLSDKDKEKIKRDFNTLKNIVSGILSRSNHDKSTDATDTRTDQSYDPVVEYDTDYANAESATVNNFLGEWYRTDVPRALSATINIDNQTADSFDIYVHADYYTHTGDYEGTVYLESYDRGVLYYNDFFIDTVYFERSGDLLTVTSENGGNLGFGANVTIDGTYTLNWPTYTNENVLNDNFTEDQIASIQELLGNDYEDAFLTPVELGLIEQERLISELSGIRYYGWLPTMNYYGFYLLIGDNGYLYFNSQSYGYRTNDPARMNDIPEGLDINPAFSVYEYDEVDTEEEYSDTSIDYSEYNALTLEIWEYEEKVLGRLDVRIYDYLFNTDSMYYAKEDFINCPKNVLYVARNEIFARYGMAFKNQDLIDYFNTEVWYYGYIQSDDFDTSVFNEYENYNLDLILSVEEELGYR